MLDDDLQAEILRNISLSGAADAKKGIIKHLISGTSGEYGDKGSNLIHILNLSSGSPRLQTNVVKRFRLVLSQPLVIAAINPFQIRCALCKNVISYPCWYYNLNYRVNHFHYFICFDKTSPNKPSTKCYRKDI